MNGSSMKLPDHIVDLMAWLVENEGSYGFYFSMDGSDPIAIHLDGDKTSVISGKPFQKGILFEIQ